MAGKKKSIDESLEASKSFLVWMDVFLSLPGIYLGRFIQIRQKINPKKEENLAEKEGKVVEHMAKEFSFQRRACSDAFPFSACPTSRNLLNPNPFALTQLNMRWYKEILTRLPNFPLCFWQLRCLTRFQEKHMVEERNEESFAFLFFTHNEAQ